MKRGEDALHDFVRDRRLALFRSAYLICGNHDDAEDLVQTTLVKVVLGWRRWQRLGNIEAYARRTLYHTFIAGRRRFWRREHAYGELPDRAVPEPDAETGMAVRAALAGLTPKQRAVLVLRFWEDQSVEATAAVLGMRENTVKSHTARGLAVLRARMERETEREREGERV
ncbi:SigE family RNA polymerase sigma factor [Streptomyces sp. CSDS2]|uniref:SigE family RNA polymerase sigma factor n=1 Tax=Streptomyces sp. CSDS2 TaxID=3055051 RepID=UPI0025B0ED9F|nr:SigE family RNA polymerase sigma factor [Streptomyces sp. CSDS2]MDN3263190.1 SigE family RNA polymerase sigma factor [Streptomyces sp. CSDS2]